MRNAQFMIFADAMGRQSWKGGGKRAGGTE